MYQITKEKDQEDTLKPNTKEEKRVPEVKGSLYNIPGFEYYTGPCPDMFKDVK